MKGNSGAWKHEVILIAVVYFVGLRRRWISDCVVLLNSNIVCKVNICHKAIWPTMNYANDAVDQPRCQLRQGRKADKLATVLLSKICLRPRDRAWPCFQLQLTSLMHIKREIEHINYIWETQSHVPMNNFSVVTTCNCCLTKRTTTTTKHLRRRATMPHSIIKRRHNHNHNGTFQSS